MKPIYRKHITTIALIWGGSLVLFLLAYMLILAPQKKSKRRIEKELVDERQTYNATLEKISEETKLRLKEQIYQLENRLNEFVLDSEDSANLIFDISQIASSKKVGSPSIGTKDKRVRSDIPNCNYISENHIDISFTAGFNEFATLLNALERHLPVVFVDNFIITRSRGDNSGHQVDMDLAVFVRKRQES